MSNKKNVKSDERKINSAIQSLHFEVNDFFEKYDNGETTLEGVAEELRKYKELLNDIPSL